MEESGFVIKIAGDASDAKQEFISLADLNKKLSKAMGADFVEATEIMKQSLVGIRQIQLGSGVTETIKEYEIQAKLANQKLIDLKTSMSDLSTAGNVSVTNFSDLGDVTAKFGDRLQGLGKVTSIVGQDMRSVGTNTSKVAYIVKTADGNFYRLTETMKTSAKGIETVDRKLDDVSGQFRKTDVEAAKFNKTSLSLSENFKRLAGRALLTIPVWFAIRGAMSLVNRTIRDGIKAIIEQDEAFQKARVNLSATAQTTAILEKQYDSLKKQTIALAQDTGQSVTTITNAFQKFATVGFDFETAMVGAEEATKLAVTRFGDAEENATSLARAFNLLANNSKETGSRTDELRKTTALIAELWKDEAFEIDELSKALERFAPIANVANFSIEETVKLLSALQTAGVRGTRAGRLLSSAILKLSENSGELEKTLGLRININETGMFQAIQTVLGEVEKLQNIDPKRAANAITALFGGVRAGTGPLALASNIEQMNRALSNVGDVARFNAEFADMQDQTFILAKRIGVLKDELAKTFVLGLTGADDFDTALKQIADSMKASMPVVRGMAVALRELSFAVLTAGLGNIYAYHYREVEKYADKLGAMSKKIGQGITGQLETNDLGRVIGDLAKIAAENEKLYQDVGGDISLDNLTEQWTKQIQETSTSLTKYLNEGLKKVDAKNLLRALENTRPDLLNLSQEMADELIEGLKEGLKDVSEEFAGERLRQPSTEFNIDHTELEKANESIINSYLVMLKNEGVLGSKILERKTSIENILGIELTAQEQLERKLAIEEALTAEKEKQNNLSSNAIKLAKLLQGDVPEQKEKSAFNFDIFSEKEDTGGKIGEKAAQTMSDFLNNRIDWAQLVRKLTPKDLEIFKTEFAPQAEQGRAKAFLRGERDPETGEPGLRRDLDLGQKDQRVLDGLSGTVSDFLVQWDQLLNKYFAPKEESITPQDLKNNVSPPGGGISTNISVGETRVEIRTNYANTGIEQDVEALVANNNKVFKEALEKFARDMATPGTPENKGVTNALYPKQNTRTP